MVEISIGEYITIAISAIVAIILIISLKIQHSDISLRQRPWITGYESSKKGSVELVNDLITLHLVNRGPVPAFNIIPKAYSSSQEPKGTLDEFVTKEGFNPIDLGPSEGYHVSILIPPDVDQKKSTVYYGFSIEYEDLNKTKRHYKVRGHFFNNLNRTDQLNID